MKKVYLKKGKETNVFILKIITDIHRMPIPMPTHSSTPNSITAIEIRCFSIHQLAGAGAYPERHTYHQCGPCHLINKQYLFLSPPLHSAGCFLGQRPCFCIFSNKRCAMKFS